VRLNEYEQYLRTDENMLRECSVFWLTDKKIRFYREKKTSDQIGYHKQTGYIYLHNIRPF